MASEYVEEKRRLAEELLGNAGYKVWLDSEDEWHYYYLCAKNQIGASIESFIISKKEPIDELNKLFATMKTHMAELEDNIAKYGKDGKFTEVDADACSTAESIGYLAEEFGSLSMDVNDIRCGYYWSEISRFFEDED